MEDYNFVEIDGERHPIRFGMNALRKFGKRTGTTLADLEKLGADMDLENALQLVYAGIEDGYRKAKQKCELDVESLADLIDNDYDALAKCMNILSQHMGGNKKQKKGKK
tara:strand:- start:558 stop:884 length:327 start_codon:yes stop_codon:yes gene_type:complete